MHRRCAESLTRQIRSALALVTVLSLLACTEAQQSEPAAETTAVTAQSHPAPASDSTIDASSHTRRAASLAPDMESIGEATVSGLLDLPPITLTGGVWEGEPFEAGSASRPRVHLVQDFRTTGDLTGNGQDDALVFFDVTTGGSGVFVHLAVMENRDGAAFNLATVYIGDRVQLIDAAIDHDQISMTLLQAGPQDAICCPGEIGHLAWQWLAEEGLVALSVEGGAERLSPAILGDTRWMLTQWDAGEPAPAEPLITLRFSEGQFIGTGGCNQYFAAIEPGAQPGEFSLGPIGNTSMACGEDVNRLEQRFLSALAAAQRFDFRHTRLLLSYRSETGSGTLRFEIEPQPDPEKNP